MNQNKAINILLVEDSPSDIKMTKFAFQESKIANNLDIVTDGEQALDFLFKRGAYTDAKRPDIIFLDLNLPKIDGREVLQKIKKKPSLKLIPVVILTNSGAPEDIVKSYDLNVNCYVRKPVGMEEFIEVVKSIDRFWFSVVSLPPEQGFTHP